MFRVFNMKKLRYVIQKHQAKNLHWDLRLELDGAARSWAIPKEPTSDGTKRLAVQVEDHEIEYMEFEGNIPEGEYGAGEVRIWDSGWWEPESLNEKKIVAILHGKKLNGRFALVNFKDKNWLFFKTGG